MAEASSCQRGNRAVGEAIQLLARQPSCWRVIRAASEAVKRFNSTMYAKLSIFNNFALFEVGYILEKSNKKTSWESQQYIQSPKRFPPRSQPILREPYTHMYTPLIENPESRESGWRPELPISRQNSRAKTSSTSKVIKLDPQDLPPRIKEKLK